MATDLADSFAAMMPPQLRCWRFPRLELAVAVLLIPLCSCWAFAITATKAEDVCPNDADPCVVSQQYEIAASGVLDFGLRTLAVTGAGRFSASADGTIHCGRLEVSGSPRHRALVAKGSQGTFQVNVHRGCSNKLHPCFDDADCSGGTCSAGDGTVVFGGAMKATSSLVLRASGSLAMLGNIVSTGKDARVRLQTTQGASLLGPVQGDDGTLVVDAGEDIVAAAPITIRGSNGRVRLWADRDVTVRSDILSLSTQGMGGSIGLDAGRDVLVEGPGGAPVRIEVSSPPTVETGGNYGSVDLNAGRDLEVAANTVLIAQSDDSDMWLDARRNLVVRGSIRSSVEGMESGAGEVLLIGRRSLSVEAGATIELAGRNGSGYEALRVRSDGTIQWDGTVRASGAGSENIGFEACLVRLGPTADIVNAMKRSHTTFLVRAGFFAPAGSMVTTYNGSNLAGVRSFADSFVVRGAFVPALSVQQFAHLDPCLTCGDGDDIETCDDGNDCTLDLCGDNGCEAVPDDSFCDDGLFCTGAERCDVEKECVREAAVDCSFLAEGCTMGVCDEASASCIAEPLRCEDGKFCNGVSVCDGNGGCLPGTPPDCSHLDRVCMEGYCAPDADRCVVRIEDHVPCDDGDSCTNEDICLLAVCKGIRDVACGDCGDASVQWGEDCDDGDGEFHRGDICGPECQFMRCGSPLGNPGPTAADALFVLRVAVGMDECDLLMCDIDHRGGITTSDALLILREAVGIEEFACYFDFRP